MVRSGLAAAVLVALAVACARAPEAPPEPAPERATAPPPAPTPIPPVEVAWTARAAADALELTQIGEPPARCTLEARREGRVTWTASRCLARRGEPVFLGPDGETVIAVDPFVPRGIGPDGTGPVVVVSRVGEIVRAFRAGDLAPGERHELSDRWLVSIERGAEHAPRLALAGAAVRLETARGAIVTLRFDGTGWPDEGEGASSAVGARRGRPDSADEVTLYRWEDAAGDVHYTVASDVPRGRVHTARRVTAEVSSVVMERVSGSWRPTAGAHDAPASSGASAAAATPSAQRPASERHSTFHVDTVNKTIPGGGYLDADAMDRNNEKQKKEMNCRDVNGVVICG